MTEAQEHKQLADYIKMQYPKVIFNSDMSGIKLTIGQAKKAAALRSDNKFPDIVLYHRNSLYNGLFIELKRTGEKLCNKNGQYKTEHLNKQADTLLALNGQGFCCLFAIGFEGAKIIIDNYMKLKL